MVEQENGAARIAAIRARLAAVPSPRWLTGRDLTGVTIVDRYGVVARVSYARGANTDVAASDAQADLIVHAPADLAWLLGRLAECERGRDQLRGDLSDALLALDERQQEIERVKAALRAAGVHPNTVDVIASGKSPDV